MLFGDLMKISYNNHRALGILIWLIFLDLGLFAQEIQMSHLELPEELGNEKIIDFIQTNDGVLWFALSNGLAEYDGYQVVYHLKGEQIDDLFLYAENKVAFLKKGGLFVLQKNKGYRNGLKIEELIADLKSNNCLAYQDGKAWFKSRDGQLLYYDGKLKPLDIQMDTIAAFTKGVVGYEAWMVTKNGRLLSIDKHSKKHYGNIEIPKNLQAIDLYDANHLLLIGERVISLKINSDSKTVFQKAVRVGFGGPHKYISYHNNRFILTNQNELLSLSLSDAGNLSLKQTIIRAHGHEVYEIREMSMQYLVPSIDQGLWVLANNRLIQLRCNAFARFAESLSFSVTSISKSNLPNQKLYAATGNGFVIHQSSEKGLSLEQLPLKFTKGNLVNEIVERNNKLWVATSGAHLFVAEHNQLINEISLLNRGGAIFNLFLDSVGNAWVCQAPEHKAVKGILRIDPNFNLKEYNSGDLGKTRVLSVDENQDLLYFGARGASTYLFQYDKQTDSVINMSIPLPFKAFDDFEVHDLAVDHQERIWLATTEGLLKYESGNIEAISLGDSKSLECTQLAISEDGSLWVGTNGFGIFQYMDGVYANFGTNDGIPTTISTYRSMLFDRKGRLWFGTQEGLVMSQQSYPSSTKAPKPEIVTVLANRKKLSLNNNELILPNNTPVTFVVHSTSFPLNRKVYEYEVLRIQEGRREIVSMERNQRTGDIALRELIGGDYELRVRSHQLTGQRRSDPLIFHFSVQEVWYKRLWAIALMGVLLIIFLLGIIKWNTLRLRSRNLALEKLVTDRTKELQQSEEELRQNTEELQAINSHLEETQLSLKKMLVKEQQYREKLEQSFKDLQVTQNQLVEAEKLAALGNLLASVGHEINSPLSAINSSSTYLHANINALFEELPKKLLILNTEERDIVFRLLDDTINEKLLNIQQSRRTLRKELEQELDMYEIANQKEIANILVQVGVTEINDNLLPLLRSPKNKGLLKIVKQYATSIRAIRNIYYGSEQSLKITEALKNYVHVNNQDKKQLASLKEGLENTLILYQYQIKSKTTLHWQYDEMPDVWCFPEELIQVWTNLINNALHAMEAKEEGVLHVELRQQDDHAIVSIKDNGKGISEDVKDRIFEPFFTTKPLGSGTGIGLDIVKKIIEKHQGQIELESRVGEGTKVTVIIPLKGQNNG